MPNASLWVASTLAVKGLARALAVELASRDVRVNVVSHGPVDTPIHSQYGMPAAEVEAMKNGLGAGTLIGRMGTPDEIAEMALMLLSRGGGFVTGAEVVCDGGWTLVGTRGEG